MIKQIKKGRIVTRQLTLQLYNNEYAVFTPNNLLPTTHYNIGISSIGSYTQRYKTLPCCLTFIVASYKYSEKNSEYISMSKIGHFLPTLIDITYLLPGIYFNTESKNQLAWSDVDLASFPVPFD